MKSIAIIVLNWQQAQLTIDTIESIKKIKHSRFTYHIFLVDNGSKDDCVNIFTQRYGQDKLVSIIAIPTNLGFSAGNNFGIRAALENKFDYILLINSDVLVDPNFLQELLSPFSKNPRLGASGPKIYFAPGFEFHKDRYKKSEIGKVIWSAGGEVDWNNVYANNVGLDEVDHGQHDTPRSDLEFVTNCCILVKSEVIKVAGLMPEDYFMYCEDGDFCQQIYRHGYQIAYQPSSIIWHRNSGSSQAGGGPFHDYFLTRNRLIFASKYASLRTNFALLRESIRLVLFKGTPWQKRGVIDFYLGKKQKGSWK
jgi:GT2 family glycosyltransferase